MMAADYLGRAEAPVSAAIWGQLDSTMIGAASSQLAGRRLVEIEGPYGLGLKAVPLADCAGADGISRSPVVPVNLISEAFTLSRRDLAAADREQLIPDLAPVACAAMAVAEKEDTILFNGIAETAGLLSAQGSPTLALSKWDKPGTAADQLISAVTKLDDAGFHGPYRLGLAPARYNLLLRRYPQADGTELEHARTITGGGVFKVPVLKKGGVLLAAGRQYAAIAIGQDMSIGFNGPVGDAYEFRITESLALLVRAPDAICVLT